MSCLLRLRSLTRLKSILCTSTCVQFSTNPTGQRSSPETRPLKIGTHDGTFHCDEALACALLKHTQPFKNAEIVRTRDEEILSTLDAVVDVGGVYDPKILHFDHHHRNFHETFGERKAVIADIVRDFDATEDEIDRLYRRVYDDFIKAIDGMDNGVPICGRGSDGRKVQMNYSDATNLNERVGRLNIHWQSPAGVTSDEQFQKAVDLCENDFVEYVLYLMRKWLPAEKVVRAALEAASSVSPSGQIMFLEIGCPWVKSLFELENDIPAARDMKYCIYHREGREGVCNAHAIPINATSSTVRLPFPENWRGLKKRELEAITGIKGSIFAHRAGFLVGHETKEGAIALAESSIKLRGD